MSRFSYFLHHLMRMADNAYDRFIIVTGEKGCLSKDTLIKTDKGDIAISELKEQKVHAYDFDKDSWHYVSAKLFDSGIKEIYEVELESGKKVKATKDHTFFVKRNDQILELPLYEINECDTLWCVGGFEKIRTIRLVGKEQTYDLSVPIYHNFVLANGILTHNSGKSTVVIELIKEYLDKFSWICPLCGAIFYKNIYVREQTQKGYRFYVPEEIRQDKVLIKCPEYYELNLKTGAREKVSGCGGLFPLSRRKKVKWTAKDFIAYNNDEAYNKLLRLPIGNPVQMDEAINFMSSLDFNKSESKEMKRLVTVIRPRRYLMFALAPEFTAIDRRYTQDFSQYWLYAYEKGECVVFEKNKAVTDDKYDLKQLQKIMPTLKYFTPTEKINKALKKHPCYFDSFHFEELPQDVYDEYELYRNAANIKKQIAEQEFNNKDIAKLMTWNIMTYWDSLAIEIARSKERKITYSILSNQLMRNPLTKKPIASEPTLRNWVRGIDQWVKTKGEDIATFSK